ncbi:uncharacterized protein EV422DRAFT_511162 [Fimicolochytrium jonesii]|uniref:uncharacterized protein n=1 Tax=Fimicolochytrium jonesii TaxID=1396493 RepID=UPI0022FDD670|nr:uncharacterized protein EV422DRAFT_511162 [Fimicolochytrium jonesii]KAI8826719.1 hypothetical protein EV422DRAFT_511162 [Fimicolochytrium jonesii]
MGGYQGKDIDYEWRTLYLTRNARDDKGQWKATLSLQRLPIPAIELPLAPAIEDGDQRILEAGKRYPSTSPRRARYKALYLKRLAAISQKTHYIPWEFDPDLDPEAFRGVKRTWNVWVKRRKQNTQTPWSTIPGLPTMISIDPGIKKFMVGYTSYGDTILFGRPSAEYITPALRKMDKIESHIGQMLERVPDIEKLREEVDARMKKWRAHAIALESLLDGDIFKRDFQDTIGDGLLSHACQLRDVIPKQKQELRERVCEEHVEEIEKLRASLGNKIDHLHIHTASFLEKFDIVLLPTFDVPKLVKRRVGQLSRLNKRILMTLQHATLRETLGHRQTVRGCGQTVHPSEAWSTQACFKCKRLSGKLRGRRFLCSDINCGNKMDRDENAPRSNLNLVMAKAISEWNPKGVEAVTEPDAIPLDRP